MSRPSRVVIDKNALRHNFKHVQTLAPGSKIMAIIKADAYGHGLIRVARTLADAAAFGVACLSEARQLRSASITTPVVLLEGPHKATDLSDILQLQLEIAIHNEFQLGILEQARIAAPLQVWLKIDTGMHRLGFPAQQTLSVLERITHCKNIKQPVRLMTHLAVANEPAHPLTLQQLDTLKQACDGLEVEKTIANSAAIINFPETHDAWVRPGLMLYGVSPLIDKQADELGLKPAMTLESELISIQQLNQGEPVGYGAAWRCPEAMPVGVVAAGYGDGFPRHARSGTPVLVNGVRCALIGHASMDMLTIDLRNQPQAKIGDRVVLWGESLPVEEIARYADTIPYELLCGVHKRLAFIERG